MSLSKIFFKHQVDWINDPAKFAICEKSRRVGISFAESYRAVSTRAMLIANGKSEDYHYIAQVESTSVGFIADCAKWIRRFNKLLEANLQPPIADLSKISQLRIPFVNGSAIHAYSSNPDALRSKGGSLCIDEAAFAPDGKALEKAAFAVVETIGLDSKLRIISTHNGLSSWFNQLCTEVKNGQRKDWSHHKVSIYDAVNNGFALKKKGPHLLHLPDIDKVNEEYLNTLKSNHITSWEQEWECKPLASGSTLISQIDYDKLAIELNTELDIIDKKFGNLYVGVDLGINDQTVIWIIEEYFNPNVIDPNLRREYRTKHVKVLKGIRTQEQQEIIKQIVNHPNVIWCAVDQGTFGLTITEFLQKNTGKVEGVSFGAPMKKVLAERVRDFIARERVSLPKERNDVREDVCCVQLTYTDSGNVSYGGRSSQGHGDAFWALSLALHAAETHPPSFAYGLRI